MCMCLCVCAMQIDGGTLGFVYMDWGRVGVGGVQRAGTGAHPWSLCADDAHSSAALVYECLSA